MAKDKPLTPKQARDIRKETRKATDPKPKPKPKPEKGNK